MKKILTSVLCTTLVACGGGSNKTPAKIPEDPRPLPGNPTLKDSANIPILLYHSWAVYGDCSYENSNLKALEEDIETLHSNGFTIVPLDYLIEWRLGVRDGKTLPEKPVAITLDDGHDLDWVDGGINDCPDQKSVATILIPSANIGHLRN